MNFPLVLALFAIPSQVVWSYCVAGLVFATGMAMIFASGDWRRSRGLDKLILFGPLFYAASVAAFGTEHFTETAGMASIIPAWIPWHIFWVYLVGTCFIAAGFSLATGIQARLAATLLSLTFFLFVVLMFIPGWIQNPRDRIALTVAFRETSFSGGALALAASLAAQDRKRSAKTLATIARYLVAIPVLFFSVEQFLHRDYLAAVPLGRLTPGYIPGHWIWTYLAALVYAIAGLMLLAGKRTRAAATWLGLTVLVVEIAVYLPIGVVDRASLENGLNYVFDTLLFCGAVLLLAGAMPRETEGPANRGLKAAKTDFKQTAQA